MEAWSYPHDRATVKELGFNSFHLLAFLALDGLAIVLRMDPGSRGHWPSDEIINDRIRDLGLSPSDYLPARYSQE